MQNTISLGPLNIPALPAMLILSVIGGHLILKLLYRERKEEYRAASDLFFTALLLFLAGWKISLLLTNWSTVIKAPLALVYLTGGIVNITAGLAAALGGVFFLIRREKYILSDIKSMLLLITLSMVILFPLALLMPAGSGGSDGGASYSSGAEKGGVTVSSFDGRPEELELTGAPVTIVNFWATWCPPCRAEIPEMIDFYKEYKDRGVRLIGVNMTTTESSAEAVKSFAADQDINFPVVLDAWGDAAGRFGISSIPVTMVFDSQGTLIRQRVGAVDSAWLKSSVRNFTQ